MICRKYWLSIFLVKESFSPKKIIFHGFFNIILKCILLNLVYSKATMEESVIISASKGDLKAFRKIFDYYMPKMRPLCRRYCNHSIEVDDILQDAFIKVFKHIESFKFEGSFEGWVRRIVINTAIGYIRSGKGIEWNGIENVKETEFINEPEEDLNDDDMEQLRAIIEKLPNGYRMVFNMYVIDDLSHKEIAEALNISEGTSRSQYSKARKTILNIFQKQRNSENSPLS